MKRLIHHRQQGINHIKPTETDGYFVIFVWERKRNGATVEIPIQMSNVMILLQIA